MSSELQRVQQPIESKEDDLEKATKTNVEDVTEKGIFAHAEHFSYTPEEGRKVLRKIDFILLPLLCGCYIFSFLDKTLLNYSSIFGLKKALHLTGSNYSWTGSIFYFGYMLGSVTWSKLVQRWPQHVGKIISGAVFTWSCIILLTPLVFNFTGLMINRFFLGVVESVTGPVFVVVTSFWWTREEQAFRTAFWLAGTPIGNFFGGVLSYGLGSIDSAIPPWKLFYVFFGSLSLLFAILLIFLMPDNQYNARWLTDREKKIAIERVRGNRNVSSGDGEWKWAQFREALKDPQTALFLITAIGNTMPSTFASVFSSQIVKGFGFTAVQTTVISSCPAALIQFSTFLIFSYWASHRPGMRLYLSLVCSVPPLIGASLLHALPTSNTAGRLAGYYLTYTHSMSFTLSTGLMASNYAGHTKKTSASGTIFVGWAAGLIAGPQFFLEKQAPNYQTAFEMLMVCYALMIVLPLIQRGWYMYENRRRERLSGSHHETIDEIEFTDKTDFEQWREFRYAM